MNEVFDNFEINLKFGLHIGWSVEGIFGSNFRIDALYQSMNVQLSRYLQNLTNEYNVDFIFSDKIAEQLSEKAQKYMRPLDILNISYEKKNFTISNY